MRINVKNKFFTRKFVPAAQSLQVWKGMVNSVKNPYMEDFSHTRFVSAHT